MESVSTVPLFCETLNKEFSNVLCEKPVILVELLVELRIVDIQDSEDGKKSVCKKWARKIVNCYIMFTELRDWDIGGWSGTRRGEGFQALHRISLRWQIYRIKLVDKTKLVCENSLFLASVSRDDRKSRQATSEVWLYLPGSLPLRNIKQLLGEVEHDIINYQNRGLCYLPRPEAEAGNTDTRFW